VATSTARNYDVWLRRFDDFCRRHSLDPTQVGPAAILAFVAFWSDGHAPTTLMRAVDAIAWRE
jgi:hypothetical protein